MLNLTLIDLDLVFALDNSSDTLTYHGCHKGRLYSGIYFTPILNRY